MTCRFESISKRFQVMFLGEPHVGKTSLITKFKYGNFYDSYKSTIGVDFSPKTVFVDKKTVRCQIWDATGQKKFRSLIPTFVNDCDAVVFVYDVTDEKSFERVSEWVDYMKVGKNEEYIPFLVGNKVDKKDRKVKLEEGENKAKELGAVFVETSAKENIGVDQLFKRVATELVAKEDDKIAKLTMDEEFEERCTSFWCWCHSL